MRTSYYYKKFLEGLSTDDQYQFQQSSINQQKDWYITHLESELGDCYNKHEPKNNKS